MPPKTKEEEKKKAVPIIIILGLGGLAAWLLRPKPIDPNKAILYGRVTNIVTQEGISNINVDCDGYTAKTDSNGEYRIINIPPGTYSVTFTDQYGRYDPATL